MANKRCKDCHESKPYEQFRKWSNQCNDCLHTAQKQHYDSNIRPHTLKATRPARPITQSRKDAKAAYAAEMRDRLGFVPVDCEYYVNGSPVLHRCPLYELCGQLVRQREDVFCELTDAELAIVEFKPTGAPEQQEQGEMVLWADTVMGVDDDAMPALEYWLSLG